MIDSLRTRLLCWLLIPLLGVAAVNIWTNYASARRTAATVTDRTLIASARAIAEQTAVTEGVIDAPVPPAALEMFSTGHGDRVYYRVEGRDGRLLTGYPDLPKPAAAPLDEAIFYDDAYRDRPVRLVALAHAVVGGGPASPVLVVVGATLNSRAALTDELMAGAFLRQASLLLGAALLLLVATQRGLAPLMRLRDAVLRRRENELDPIPVAAVDRELRPLVGALNLYMRRVEQQMAAQRRFVANAAHQLKTPLTLLGTQAAVALRTTHKAALAETLTALEASTRQTARLASQLLVLARAEPGSRRPRQEPVDLAEAARQVLTEFSRAALQRGIDLGLEAEDGAALAAGDGMLLREMIVNLVDNALRYTREGGTVTVSVARQGGRCVLRVTDDGPGIPAAERERVFERFYRVLGSAGEGSGLGLAIVREVAEAAGGTVQLDEPPGGGLVVEVSLPALATAGEDAAAIRRRPR